MYHRYRVNEKRALSLFGTKKGTSETYLLSCVFDHYKPFAPDKIQLQDDAAERLMKDLPQYQDCFVYHDKPLYITRDKREYHWEFVPSKQYLIENEDKLNHAFFILSRSDRFKDGEFIKEGFNPNKVAYNRNIKSAYVKGTKHRGKKMLKVSLPEYLEKNGVK